MVCIASEDARLSETEESEQASSRDADKGTDSYALLKLDLSFLGSPIGTMGDEERTISSSTLLGGFEMRLNIPRRLCFDGELGGLMFSGDTSSVS